MFVAAYSEDREYIVYFDTHFNKYIAKGGSLAWRINNPGLVHSHSHVAGKHGSIGACGPYSIFSSPEKGYQALSAWLHLKKYYNSKIIEVAKHYQSECPEEFLAKLTTLITNLPIDKPLNSFSKDVFEALIQAIAKLCNYVVLGNEEFIPLPKIIGKIENVRGKTNSYLISNDIVLSTDEAISWIKSHRLDASIVHNSNGEIHLRSRPNHSFWHMNADSKYFSTLDLPVEQPINTIVRVISKKKPNQCIWGFVNGISNTKEKSLSSMELISSITNGEEVISLPNDSWFLFDGLHCLLLKLTIDTPIVILAEKFFRYLLTLSWQEKPELPIVIFAHSQGAIIAELALKRLSASEKTRLRIFTLGGGSLILPGESHVDSHNYVSAADPVSRAASPHLQILAMSKYEGLKNGLRQQELVQQLAMRDALHCIDSVNPPVIEVFVKERTAYYEQQFQKIPNVTILEPKDSFEHGLLCYQSTLKEIIKKYQENRQ